MKIRVNGEWKIVQEHITLEQFLMEEQYPILKIAVECSGKIVPKAEYALRPLQEGDRIEVVRFVGGG